MESELEGALRARTIAWVQERADSQGGFLSRQQLMGFRLEGHNLPIIDYSRGIRNPRSFASTLSIVSAADGPYDDITSDDGFLHYSYRVGDPDKGDNRKLRNAVDTQAPLIFFRKEMAGVYFPTVPVFAIEDRPDERCVIIAMDEAFLSAGPIREMPEFERAYARRLAYQRLHQPAFRARVMYAYETRCAVCRFHHGEFLDAAHILPDRHESGDPTVTNGLALCKIHHAAYDHDVLGITPDYQVTISGAMLHETDGPMLKHGLQEMHGRHLTIPKTSRDRPNRDFLSLRYQEFLARA